MAVFRGEYHLDRAIDAALAVRKTVNGLPKENSGIGYAPQVTIGVNSGEMISGNIGSANLRRLDFTVIGDTVNTAQRLQSAGKANQIIISEAAYRKIKESFRCEPVGEAILKNKANPVMVYEVIE
jgi:adenylate cyclase